MPLCVNYWVKNKETKGKYKEKQRPLLKIWLIYSSNLATLTTV
jgi:hypothetical protein